MQPQFRHGLIVHVIMLVLFVVCTALTVAAGLWPVAVMQMVFVLGWTARLVVLFRVRRLGGYADEAGARPPTERLNREYIVVLRTQLVGWVSAGIYFAVVHFWLGVAVAAALAYITLPVMQLLRRRAQPAQDDAE
jgi:hypothetical protein